MMPRTRARARVSVRLGISARMKGLTLAPVRNAIFIAHHARM